MNKLLFLIIALFSVTAQCQNSERPNIIMMIGDGMGISQISSMYSNNNYTPLKDRIYWFN